MKGLHTYPLWIPAVGAMIGGLSGRSGVTPDVGATVVLLVLGMAFGRLVGATLILGVVVWLHAATTVPAVDSVDLDRPVEIAVRLAGHPVCHDDGCRVWARARWLRQRPKGVSRFRADIRLTFPIDTPVPAWGSGLWVRGRLDRTPPFRNGTITRAGPWRVRIKSARLMSVTAAAPWPGRHATAARRYVDAVWERQPATMATALARALISGDTSRLPDERLQAFRRSGLAHLLAVSGLHMSLVTGLAWMLGGGLARRSRLLVTLAVVVGYAALVGPRPSVLRAALMTTVVLLALLTERAPGARNALGGAVAIAVAIDPVLLDSLGFQLSVSATAAILLLAPTWQRDWTLLPRFVRLPLAVSCAAQLATTPWLVTTTGGVVTGALVLNLVAVPWLTIVLVASWLWLGLALCAPEIATWCVPWLDGLVAPSAWLETIPAGPWLFVATSLSVTVWWVIVIVIGALVTWPRRLLPWCVAALVGLIGMFALRPVDSHIPELILFDVGQGDAILLRDGPRTMLIDGGGWRHGDVGGWVLVPALARLGVGRLDRMVMTHADSDHCRGLVDVGRRLPVAEVVMSPGWTAPCATAVASLARRVHRVVAGDEIEHGRWRLEVLHPEPTMPPEDNEDSLVLVATVEEVAVLLTGDIGVSTERSLLRDERAHLDADVLKVGHHGSRGSTSLPFLRAVSPRLALLSVGADNPYGHPASEVVERLGAARVDIRRTDHHGGLRLRFGSRRIAVQPLTRQ